MTADLKRLGKRGSYRLGRLRAQGIAAAGRSAPLRPAFTRPQHRGPTLAWLAVGLAGTLIIAAGAAAGLWFVPFIAGLAAGLANWLGGWRARIMMLAVTIMAAGGWAIPLGWFALDGNAAGATARVIAALLGLPAFATTGVLAALAVAAVQALAGLWLGRALTPFPGRG